MSISMYFGVSWLDPRLQVNETAAEWTEVKTGPKDVRTFFRFIQIVYVESLIMLRYKGNTLQLTKKAFLRYD